MQSGFYYIIKDEFFDRFTVLGSKFKYNKGASRPTFCCFEDAIYKGLFWAIPTGTIEGKDMERIKSFIALDEKDIRHAYYHIGYTNRKAIFYISSAFPVTEKYVLREYTTNGVPLEMKRTSLRDDIRKKLLKILTFENRNPNKLETHITNVKTVLIQELQG